MTSNALEYVAGDVQAVWPDELRSREAELCACEFISVDEGSPSPGRVDSPSATAASLALWIRAAARSSRTLSRSPARRRIVEPVTPTASLSTTTTSFGFAFERSRAPS